MEINMSGDIFTDEDEPIKINGENEEIEEA